MGSTISLFHNGHNLMCVILKIILQLYTYAVESFLKHWGCSSRVKPLLVMHKALGSIPGTRRKKKLFKIHTHKF
jgi:hypothetical protein